MTQKTRMTSSLSLAQPLSASVASRWRRSCAVWGVCVGMALTLAACDAERIEALEEGVATEADVRARFGPPEQIWLPSDMASVPGAGAAAEPGARTFEYNRQPAGHTNYMITLDAGGTMSALRQTLTPRNFERVVPGMPMEQVRKLLGKPMKITPYALQQEMHYDWRFYADPSRSQIFTVVFDNDLRVRRTATVDDPGRQGQEGKR